MSAWSVRYTPKRMLCLRGFNAEIKEPSSIIKKRWPGLLYFSMNYLKLWRVLVLSPLRSSLKLILHLHGLVSSSLPKEINHKLYCELSKKHLLEIYACGNNKHGCFGCGVLGGWSNFFYLFEPIKTRSNLHWSKSSLSEKSSEKYRKCP